MDFKALDTKRGSSGSVTKLTLDTLQGAWSDCMCKQRMMVFLWMLMRGVVCHFFFFSFFLNLLCLSIYSDDQGIKLKQECDLGKADEHILLSVCVLPLTCRAEFPELSPLFTFSSLKGIYTPALWVSKVCTLKEKKNPNLSVCKWSLTLSVLSCFSSSPPSS